MVRPELAARRGVDHMTPPAVRVPAASIGKVPANVPVALLPVRIETRFTTDTPPTLQIRIYPSDLSADAHEQLLTAAEAKAAKAFAALPLGDTEPRRREWAKLAAHHGINRAAWIVQVARAEKTAGAGARRKGTWTRAVQAVGLPNHWVALGYRNGQRVAESPNGALIRSPLALGPDPTANDRSPGSHVDAEMEWMVDYARALRDGMALEIENCPPLDRLVVIGVRTAPSGSVPATALGVRALEQLLDAHRFTDGLELLAQGTPTNNTAAARSGYTAAAPDADEAFGRLFGRLPDPQPDLDGARLAGALAIDRRKLVRVLGFRNTEGQEAQAMNAALWPTLWGHTLKLLGEAVVPAAAIEALRRHFIDWVRASGPLATVRAGRQAFGVLPVLVPARAVGPQDDPALRGLAAVLTRTQPLFTASGFKRSKGQPSRLLKHAESAQQEFVRAAFTPRDDQGWFARASTFMGRSRDAVRELRSTQAHEVSEAATLLGIGAAHEWPRWVLLPERAGAPWPVARADGRPRPRVVSDGLAPQRYLQALVTAQRSQLEGDGPDEQRDTLLYLLVRSALLQVFTGAAPPAPAPWEARGRLDGSPEPAPSAAEGETYGGVHRIKDLDTARLDRLLAQALDLSAYRWDAWATSLATRRLAHVRRQGAAGLIVGGYGWVENLAPPATTPRKGEHPYSAGTTVEVAPDGAGCTVAPSVAQAITAAVLWSGQRRHDPADRPDGVQPLALDLSSRRVRLARSIVEAIHAGQRLGELLGYRFERALQAVGKAAYIAPLRRLAPLDLPAGSSDPRDARVAATDVVDGLALLRRDQNAEPIPWGSGDIPPRDDTVDAAIAGLREAMDAVGDVLLAEAVHHTLQGRTGRASASLAALARGELTTPELEFVRTPRTGTGLTHRLMVLAPARPPAGWPTTPRGRAEPALARWAASVLGSPAKITGAVALVDPGTGDPLASIAPIAITAADLQLGPLDLLAIAARPAELNGYLTWWLRDSGRWPAAVPVHAVATVVPGAAPAAGQLTLAEALALARCAAAVTASARAVDGRDLTAGANPRADIAELTRRYRAARKRVDAVVERLRTAVGSEDERTLRAALVEAWFLGVRDVLPSQRAAVSALVQQATGALAELRRRSARADAATPPADAEPAGALSQHLERLEVLHGDGFRALPRITLVDPALPSKAIAATDLTDAPPGQDAAAWFARLAQVREPVAALQTLSSLSDALGTGQPLRLHVGQLPVPPSGKKARWAGLPLAEGARPRVRASLVFAGATPPATGAISGMLVDSVDETVPSSQETAAVTFQYDAPGAQAPNVVLLAVPPVGHDTNWRLTDLEEAVLHAAELTRARLADPADLGPLRSLLPAVHLPAPHAAPAPQRLFAPPPDFAVAAETPPKFSISPATIMQGNIADVTLTGTHLRNARYEVVNNPLVRITSQGEVSDTGAKLTIAVDPFAPAGPCAIAAYVGSETGLADPPLTVAPAPRITSVLPTRLAQALDETTTVELTITGQAMPRFTGVAVSTGTVAVTAKINESTAVKAIVTLQIPGAERPPSEWDPTSPFGPRKPPPPLAPVPSDVAVTLTLHAPELELTASGIVLTALTF